MNARRLLVRSQYSCRVLLRGSTGHVAAAHEHSFPVQKNQLGTWIADFNAPAALGCRGYHTSRSNRMPVGDYTAVERGEEHTDSYKVFILDNEGPISPFHDIPLVANQENKTYNMVVEVPRWTNAKMEIDTKSPLHPIVQDQKKGKLRYVRNSFPHHGYIWNYGAFPQTWENPNHVDENTGEKGDNDPVDCCEIGGRVAKRGDLLEVKLIGTLAMVDDGETDWKVMVIDVKVLGILAMVDDGETDWKV